MITRPSDRGMFGRWENLERKWQDNTHYSQQVKDDLKIAEKQAKNEEEFKTKFSVVMWKDYIDKDLSDTDFSGSPVDTFPAVEYKTPSFKPW